METIDFTRMGDHRVEVDDTPVELYQEDLLDQLGVRRRDDLAVERRQHHGIAVLLEPLEQVTDGTRGDGVGRRQGEAGPRRQLAHVVGVAPRPSWSRPSTTDP